MLFCTTCRMQPQSAADATVPPVGSSTVSQLHSGGTMGPKNVASAADAERGASRRNVATKSELSACRIVLLF